LQNDFTALSIPGVAFGIIDAYNEIIGIIHTALFSWITIFFLKDLRQHVNELNEDGAVLYAAIK